MTLQWPVHTETSDAVTKANVDVQSVGSDTTRKERTYNNKYAGMARNVSEPIAGSSTQVGTGPKIWEEQSKNYKRILLT